MGTEKTNGLVFKTFQAPKKLIERVKRIAQVMDRSESWVIRKALELELPKWEKRA